jgi:myosin heavy subunit
MHVSISLSFSQSLWSTVGAILHLGNMRYEDSREGLAQFKDISLAGNVAKVCVTYTYSYSV